MRQRRAALAVGSFLYRGVLYFLAMVVKFFPLARGTLWYTVKSLRFYAYDFHGTVGTSLLEIYRLTCEIISTDPWLRILDNSVHVSSWSILSMWTIAMSEESCKLWIMAIFEWKISLFQIKKSRQSWECSYTNLYFYRILYYGEAEPNVWLSMKRLRSRSIPHSYK